ncbi:MAG: efflux transporter outer membrane subunit [Bdellovibrionota bacterium]
MKPWLLAFVLLQACSMAPKYERLDAPVPSNYSTPASPVALAGDGPRTNDEDLKNWKQHFTDPGMQRFIDAVLENNKELKIAALRVEELRALYRIQRSEQLPSLGANGSLTRGKQFDYFAGAPVTSSIYDARVQLMAFELDFFGRVKSLSDAALNRYLGTEVAHRSVLISLVAQAASAYIAEISLGQQEKLALETLSSREDTLKIDKSRFEKGISNALELKTSEMLVGTSRASVAEVRRQREINRNNLRILAGRFDFTPEESTLLVDTIRFPDLQSGVPSELLARRPDILSAEFALKAENANIGAARAAFFPSISLTSHIGSTSTDLDDLFKGSTETWSFIPTINIPIFYGGRNIANLDAANVRKNVAVLQYEQAIQNAFREVRDALVGHQLIDEQVAAQKSVRDADAERARLAKSRYDRGVAGYLEYLDAQRSQFDSDLTYLKLHELRLSNDIALYRALGGGWDGTQGH